MRRRLLAVTTALALAAAPAAALAQEPEEPVEPVEETSALDQLADALQSWAATLLGGGDEASEEGDGDELDAVVDALEVALSDLFSGLMFSQLEAEALEEAAELAGDGEESEEESETSEGDEGADGEVVSTVAQCAPRGGFGALVEGLANHGEYVTAAAHGETVLLAVPTLETDAEGLPTVVAPEEGSETAFDLTTVEGAEDLCAALDVVYQARLLQLEVDWEDVDATRDARVLAREQCRIERLRARTGASEEDPNEVCAELRERVRTQHEAERAERAAEREQARADRDAERQARAAEREQAKADREADREADHAARAEAREQAKAERASTRGKGRG